jgi:hypothetical protein
MAESLRGTFALTPIEPHPLFNQFAVTDVNWLVTLGDEESRITGSGTYRIGGEFARMHQLELDLRLGDQPLEHFDSGFVLGGAEFPQIKIRISISGESCFDTVIQVSAESVPPSDISGYELIDSSFLTGCFPPCMCPILIRHPVVGRFSLVDISRARGAREFAVVHVDWRIPTPSSADPVGTTQVRGFGLFRYQSEPGASPRQRMSLDLMFGDRGPILFDSDWVPSNKHFRVGVDVAVARNKFHCHDEVFDVRSLRISDLELSHRNSLSVSTSSHEHNGAHLGQRNGSLAIHHDSPFEDLARDRPSSACRDSRRLSELNRFNLINRNRDCPTRGDDREQWAENEPPDPIPIPQGNDVEILWRREDVKDR